METIKKLLALETNYWVKEIVILSGKVTIIFWRVEEEEKKSDYRSETIDFKTFYLKTEILDDDSEEYTKYNNDDKKVLITKIYKNDIQIFNELYLVIKGYEENVKSISLLREEEFKNAIERTKLSIKEDGIVAKIKETAKEEAINTPDDEILFDVKLLEELK